MHCPRCRYKQSTMNTKIFHLIDNEEGIIKQQCPSCGFHTIYTPELFSIFIEAYSQEIYHKPYEELTDEEKTPRHFYKTIQFYEVLCGE